MLYESILITRMSGRGPEPAGTSPGTSGERTLKILNFIIFWPSGCEPYRQRFCLFQCLWPIPQLSQASLIQDKLGKITKSHPEHERPHQISKMFAKLFNLSEFWLRETSSVLPAYYSRASTGECSTSYYFAQLRGEMAQKVPGEARRRTRKLQKVIF